jgi:hypothetical protein
VSAYDIAAAYVGLGDRDQAIGWLERGYQERTHWMALLKSDPRLDRSDPTLGSRACWD